MLRNCDSAGRLLGPVVGQFFSYATHLGIFFHIVGRPLMESIPGQTMRCNDNLREFNR